MAYVLKLTDPQKLDDFIYIGKGCILGHGKYGWFLPDSVFDTTGEAVEHIQVCIDSGWYRADITHSDFEVVEVKLYPDLNTGFYYTEDEYARYIAEDFDEKILAAVKALKALRQKDK